MGDSLVPEARAASDGMRQHVSISKTVEFFANIINMHGTQQLVVIALLLGHVDQFYQALDWQQSWATG